MSGWDCKSPQKQMHEWATDHGRMYMTRVVMRGDCYGLNDCLTHEESDPLVEFYLQKKPGMSRKKLRGIHGERGFFTSRYYLSTLCDTIPYPRGDRGIHLEGGDLESTIDGWKLSSIVSWAKMVALHRFITEN